MPKHFTDFSEYPVNTTPSDWTQWIGQYEIIEVRDIDDTGQGKGGVQQGVKYLLVNPASSADQRALTWDKVPATLNGQIYMEYGVVTELSRDVRAAIRLDPSKNTDLESADLVMLGFTPNEDAYKFSSYVDGDLTGDSMDSAGINTNDVFCQLISFSGDLYEVKQWNKAAESEPVDPQFSVTDSGNGVAGLVGLASYTPGAFYIHAFGVGTGGDPAPRSMEDADQTPAVEIDQSDIALGDTLTGTATNFESAPTTVTLSDGVSPDYAPTPTITADGDNWDFSVTVENFAAQAKAAGEGSPIQGLVPGTITVTVE